MTHPKWKSPHSMDAQTFDTLLDEIVSGATLKNALATAHTSWRSLSLHLVADESAASRYARARSDSAHFYADKAQEAVEAAYDKTTATVARVQAEVYRWRAGVANPLYGDKLDVTSLGERIVSGVIMLPPEDAPQPLATPSVTARILGDGASLDSVVDAVTHEQASERTGVGEGVGGGAGTGSGE